MECRKRKRAVECFALWLFLSWKCWIVGAMELTYSIAEELQPGSVVGNIAKDLGLDLAMITERNLQVVMDSGAQFFEVNGNGALVIKHTIDRERLCELNSVCTLNVRIMLQNPLKIFRVVVLVEDVNDNAPQFPTRNISLEISEAAMPGARFRLESAQDPDVGTNSLRTYLLSSNDCFVLNVVTKSDGSKFPELVLEKALDREKQATFQLLLTALDGGRPEKSGTSLVVIKVLDVNDNAPVFGQPTKKVSLLENSPPGTLVTKLNATDADSGLNGEISFMFSKYTPERILKLFSVDSVTGEVQVTGEVDFEVANVYDITVQARDKGSPAMEGSCNIKVEVTDVNDNTPVLTVNLLMNPIKEDTEPGTVVAFINVEDEDSGKNAEVTLHIGKGLPFKLSSSFGDHYTVVTEGHLDRETQSEYTIVVTATDSGSPPLSSKSTFTVSLADVNDNAPVFSQPSYMAEVAENNAPGVAILTVSASDRDAGENARLSFSVLESAIDGVSVSSYVYVDPEEGHIRAMRSLDHERLKAFQLVVQAKDAGTPPRAANVTVHVFVVDENDNVPAVVYPVFLAGSTLRLTAPRHAPAGFFLSRIVAVDPDSGHNAWLLYSISPGQHSSLFRVGPHTGELRTARRLSKEEEDEHREEGPVYDIVVVVQDNGSPSLSTTVAVSIVVEEKDLHISTNTKGTSPYGGLADMTLYLIVSLGCVSAVSFLTFVALMVWCLRHRGDHTDNCCIPRRSLRSRHVHRQPSQKNLQLRLNTDGPIKYVEVVGQHPEANTHTYRPCYSTLSSRSDFVFVKTPMMSHDTLSMTLSRKHLVAAANEQKPPNADWRFSQNQRPGPSGAGPRPEESGAMAGTGPWPNPPTEAEQLQALMAAANEVSEATATLTPGTMGLSTRYGPQFTLQHVPDYRQNVYIPGSTATLTANQQQALPPAQPQPQPAPPAQADAPKAAQTPASKKKSAKKEKK